MDGSGLERVRVDQRYRGHGGRHAILAIAIAHGLSSQLSRCQSRFMLPRGVAAETIRGRTIDWRVRLSRSGRDVDGGWLLEDRAPLPADVGGDGWRWPCLLSTDCRPIGRTPTSQVPLGGGSGLVVNGDTLLHADRDRQRQPRQPDRLHLRALRRPRRAGGRRRRPRQRRARHDGRRQRRPRLRGDPVRPGQGAAGEQRQRLPDRRPRAGPDVRGDRLQARPHHRLLVRRDMGTRRGAGHHRQSGVRPARRLRRAGDGQQQARRHDPRRVQPRTCRPASSSSSRCTPRR